MFNQDVTKQKPFLPPDLSLFNTSFLLIYIVWTETGHPVSELKVLNSPWDTRGGPI